MAVQGMSREELAAINARLAEEQQRADDDLFPRERQDVQLLQRHDGHEWLTVDGVPVKRRVAHSSGARFSS
jgi:hypothetical protein